MNNNPDNFFDSKTILAIILMGLVLIGWNFYTSKKYREINSAIAATTTTLQPDQVSAAQPVESTSQNDKAKEFPKELEVPEKLTEVISENASFKISSSGLSIKDYTLLKHFSRQNEAIKLGALNDIGLFKFSLVDGRSLNFQIEEEGPYLWSASTLSGNTKILVKLEYNSKDYNFKYNIALSNIDKSFPGLKVSSGEHHITFPAPSFFLPTFDTQEIFVKHENNVERFNTTSPANERSTSFLRGNIVSIGTQYFGFAMLDRSGIIPSIEIKKQSETVELVEFNYMTSNVSEQVNLEITGFAGPKSSPLLKNVDPQLVEVVNFGFFGPIGKVLLEVIRWFYGFFPNWGLAIVLCTVLVRFAVFPFNYMSYKSTQKMVALQPKIAALKEKFKEDPTRLNTEMMTLMRSEKVNPLGGCLPLLLQMPIFFALFQVLGHSIELYQAPFIFWIEDLSLKDPYYILPVLVGAVTWAQQKITPAPVDPAQAKILQWMPVIFSIFMIGLPSGLALYTFVSTLFGVVQQQFFLKTMATKQ